MNENENGKGEAKTEIVRIEPGGLALVDFTDAKSVAKLEAKAKNMIEAFTLIHRVAIGHLPAQTIMAMPSQKGKRPYFSEAALQRLWGMVNMLFGGGGELVFLTCPGAASAGPSREPIPHTECGGELGHFRYRTMVALRHPALGSVHGFGVASSLDSFLGTHHGTSSKGIENVSENAVMQHSRTRAVRSVLEEVCQVVGMTWEELAALGLDETTIREKGGSIDMGDKEDAEEKVKAAEETAGSGGDRKPRSRTRSSGGSKGGGGGGEKWKLSPETKRKISAISKSSGVSFDAMTAYAKAELGYQGKMLFAASEEIVAKVLEACEKAPEAVKAAAGGKE